MSNTDVYVLVVRSALVVCDGQEVAAAIGIRGERIAAVVPLDANRLSRE